MVRRCRGVPAAPTVQQRAQHGSAAVAPLHLVVPQHELERPAAVAVAAPGARPAGRERHQHVAAPLAPLRAPVRPTHWLLFSLLLLLLLQFVRPTLWPLLLLLLLLLPQFVRLLVEAPLARASSPHVRLLAPGAWLANPHVLLRPLLLHSCWVPLRPRPSAGGVLLLPSGGACSLLLWAALPVRPLPLLLPLLLLSLCGGVRLGGQHQLVAQVERKDLRGSRRAAQLQRRTIGRCRRPLIARRRTSGKAPRPPLLRPRAYGCLRVGWPRARPLGGCRVNPSCGRPVHTAARTVSSGSLLPAASPASSWQ